MATVKLDSIHKQYGDTPVLRNVDLSIQDGEFLTLVGPSGCGKSTLLRIIAGLETQSDGHVVIDDELVDKISPSDRNLSMVFQSYALYPHLTVADNIAVPLRMRRMNFWQRIPLLGKLIPGTLAKNREIEDLVRETAESLGLQDLLERKPGQLSGGQRQRVAVGRALVRHPRAFLLDEPLSNLDAKLRVHMRAEITQLHRQLQATFIYVTHDQAEAMTMSDRIVVMMGGELIQVGTPNEVYHDPRDLRVAEFIGSPKINVLEAQVDDAHRVSLFGRVTDIVIDEASAMSLVTLAVRPENLFLAQQEAIDSFEVTVELVENLGAEVFIHGQVTHSREKIVLKQSSEVIRQHKLDPGETIWIGFDPVKSLLFDAQGKRVSTGRIETLKAEVVNG